MRRDQNKLVLWGALAVLALLGAFLLVLPEIASGLPSAWESLSTAFGTALLIAAVLGASVDLWLKRELLRDAYQTLFGYLLPDELKAKLAWISDQKLFADRLDLRLIVGPPDEAGLVTLSIELQSEVRNISSETVRWPPLFAVDKWFHPGRESKLISMRTTVNGVTSSDMTIRSDDPFAVGGWLPELSRKPGDRVKFVAEAEEIRRVSDAYYLNLTRATPKPQVSVRVPEGIEYRVMFGNREQAQVQAVGAHTEALPGTLLPGQVIQVRWWPKSGGDA